MRRIIIIILLFVIACTPQPYQPAPAATPTQESIQDTPKTINPNPGLALGECSEATFGDAWGYTTVQQCMPKGYSLYQVHQTEAGENDSGSLHPTTVPVRITYNGDSYTVYPFGRAGQVGYSSPLMALQPGCYKMAIAGFNSLTGDEKKFGLGVNVGSHQMEIKPLIGKGQYSYNWFYNAESLMSVNIIFYAYFAYGDAVNGESFLTFTGFEVSPVSIGHCN